MAFFFPSLTSFLLFLPFSNMAIKYIYTFDSALNENLLPRREKGMHLLVTEYQILPSCSKHWVFSIWP